MSNRVRYGKVEVIRKIRRTNSIKIERIPKNTLSTIRDDDLIHFGIARCNIELDHFDKKTGKLIAKNRAELAASFTDVEGIPGRKLKSSEMEENLIIHQSGLRGTVKVNNIVELLQYFETIDAKMLPERLQMECVTAVGEL